MIFYFIRRGAVIAPCWQEPAAHFLALGNVIRNQLRFEHLFIVRRRLAASRQRNGEIL